MKKQLAAIAVAIALLLGGCFAPRPLEFGQDKIEKFPAIKQTEKETQRQAAQRAAQRADETLIAALKEGSSSAVTLPAKETGFLTESVSISLGPPIQPASPTVTSEELARRLDTATAKFNLRVDNFKEDNNVNIGRSIEGTGIFQIGYVSYLALLAVALVVCFILFKIGSIALKAYAVSNPAVGVGLNVVRAGGAVASKAMGQLIKGGENFKYTLKEKIPGISEDLEAKILEHFRTSQMKAQDEDVQFVVKDLTK